ncbi:MAG TPA: hypothetical protein PKA19_01125 [Bacillota bacterium]|nr:hypothetical protein [Bacillota bacterium]
MDVYEKGYRAAYEELFDHFKDYDAVYFTLDVNNITSWAALRIIHEVFHYFSRNDR